MRPLAALVLAAVLASPVLAGQGAADEPLPSFLALSPGTPSLAATAELVSGRADQGVLGLQSDAPRPTGVAATDRPPDRSRPIVHLPKNPARIVSVAPDRQPQRLGGAAAGVASWYCFPGRSRCTRGYGASCLCAAIRRDLLARLRGHYVTVRAEGSGRSVRIRVVDCNCGSHANLIDLYADAFRRLAPLSLGRVRVRVTWN